MKASAATACAAAVALLWAFTRPAAGGWGVDPNAVGRIRSPFQGEVVSVTANSVSVKSTKGTSGKTGCRTVSFAIKPEASIVRDGKTCPLTDLKKGDTVSVTFTTKQGSSLHRVTQVSAGKSE